MTWEELDAKFKMATRLTMSPANGGMVVDAIVSMHSANSPPAHMPVTFSSGLMP